MSNKHKHKGNGPRPGVVNVMAPRPPSAFVDIVMPVFGEWQMAEEALASVPGACEGMNETYRVIVVDNGTPAWQDQEKNTITPADQAIGLRKRLRSQDAYFRLDQNRGYPEGVNFAVSKGTSPLILVLTADVVLATGCVAALVRRMDNPDVGVAGPMLLFPEGSTHGPPGRVQHAGLVFDIKGRPFHQFIGWQPTHPKVNVECDVAAVTGACFITRRSLWSDIQGFSAVYGVGTFEDVDYCFAVRAQGKRVLFAPEARGTHGVGGSIQVGTMPPNGFPLPMNETIFKGRWAHMLAWDEWRRW